MKTIFKLLLIGISAFGFVGRSDAIVGIPGEIEYLGPHDRQKKDMRDAIKKSCDFLEDLYQIDLSKVTNYLYKTNFEVDDALSDLIEEKKNVYEKIAYLFEQREKSTSDITDCAKCNKLIDVCLGCQQLKNDKCGIRLNGPTEIVHNDFNVKINLSEDEYNDIVNKISNKDAFQQLMDENCETCKLIMKYIHCQSKYRKIGCQLVALRLLNHLLDIY